jgi:hypothetical protein
MAAEPRLVKTTNDARQGETGHHVRRVLGVGTGAVAVIFAALLYPYLG